jgi:hypothetical protein
MERRVLPDRVTLLNADGGVIEIHAVPIGMDPDVYAREMLERQRSIGQQAASYSVAKDMPVPTEPAPQPILAVTRQLQHSTVRLECTRPSGEIASGTGFHIRLRLDEQTFIPALVTNRHVVRDAAECAIHFTLADKNGTSSGIHERFVIKPFQWLDHPDPNVDLALIPIQPWLIQLAAIGKRPFYIDLTEEIIPAPSSLAGLSPLEDILMVGYPNGIWDSVNNFPIFRRGITATACNLDYQGRSEFLVDAAVFPGSSGSPVFIFNEGTYLDGNKIVFGGRLLFIGVLYAVHLHTAQGEIRTVTVPTDTKSMAFSAIPNNLGICIRAARILDFKESLKKLVSSGQSNQTLT